MKEFMKRLAGICFVITALFIFWMVAYWLTSLVYKVYGLELHELARQIITSFLGFSFFGFGMYFIRMIPYFEEQQNKYLYPMIQAMKLMAEGNFKIDLSYYREGNNHPFTKIAESVGEMADKLGAMEEMRQEFISNVSHEIQSPLTSISGFANALKNDDLTKEERAHYLEIIENESTRLSKLSENLLKLTSLESHHLTLEKSNYRLDYQLRRIILANEPQWQAKNIEIEANLEPIMITADEELLDQVWINLLHNSIKFTPEKGTITVTASKNEEELIITIEDTGIGMNEETVMHMFERFYKADPSRNRNSGGSGLGLSIVKKIVDLHLGEIRVESEIGKGTKISVTLNEKA
ncbi:HAMP domain-containing histidine kinase [Metabacillus sp. GX 13764]|uniref:sensor histidine kinase n=1 Tax=Metabacillus kandeliae TaxID=2900151 RepID=UPI001E2A4577|nr:HAMP domain-containing sensor histidine kinase [Metabacillus kandeliae]MCD7035372.1 HAMP domain-containing histidine kinase [Metabacillus kandeliae]